MLLVGLIKLVLGAVSGLGTFWLLLLPPLGVTLSVLILYGLGSGEALQALATRETTPNSRLPSSTWYSFPLDVARADLSSDLVATAGAEEHFPWHLAPLRALAILTTVGLGAAMGTESPAAHIGTAAGAWLGSRPGLRRLVRPAALGGGAAGVAVLMGIPLVGTFFMLELGQRKKVPLSLERVVAALVGGLVGWGINLAFGLNLIRLVVPVPAGDLWEAVASALLIGGLAGAVTSFSGEAIYWARGWKARQPIIRLLVGALVMVSVAAAIALIATPAAAFGPGGAAILWAETAAETTPYQLLAVALLRAASTTAAVVAGGCGGVFVPFMAIGDLTGRVFAVAFGVPADLAGAAGAAAGIAGGYRLPFTAVAMVLGIGGANAAKLTCFATVVVSAVSGLVIARAVNTLSSSLVSRIFRIRSSES
jgi:H+/Cl- antiporter ClcA